MTAVETLTWDEVGRRAAAGAIAILPVGAGAKQHGLHLPMGADRIQAEWLAARVAERIDALVWPTLTYGHYPAFVDYPGSVSLSAEAFETVVAELAEGLVACCSRGVAILDTGISTSAPIDRAISRLPEGRRVEHLKIHEGPLYRAAAARLETQSHGGHADELETARLLAIAPAVVAMERAEVGTRTRPSPGPLQRRDPMAANYSASGSIGDPRGATAQMGEALLEAMVADLVQTLNRLEW